MTCKEINDIFHQFEIQNRLTIPLYLKNLLTKRGYDTGVVLASITETDIEEIEKYAKTELYKRIDKDLYREYYGYSFSNPDKAQDFEIPPGHRKLIFLLKQFFSKTGK